MISYGFVNEIILPTYVSPSTGHNVSCLDHIWHNFDIDRRSYILQPNMSDHFAVSTVFLDRVNSGTTVIKFRDYSDINKQRFTENIIHELSQFDPPNNNVNDYANSLINFLYMLLNKFFPIKSKTVSEK